MQRGVDAALGPHFLLVKLKNRPRPRVEVGRLPHLPLGVRRRHHGALARDVALEDEREEPDFQRDLEHHGRAAHDVLRELDLPHK